MVSRGIYFQAHRGAIEEAPENTMVAYRHAWRIAGAIPEVDVRTTADGVLVCLHDATLARTTNSPAPTAHVAVADLSLAEVQRWQTGADFASATGELLHGLRVPTLKEVLDEMVQDPNRRLYVEIKDAAVAQVVDLLDGFAMLPRVIFISGSQSTLDEVQVTVPGAPAMTWIGGDAATIPARFEQALTRGLRAISQLQLHLPATVHAGRVEYQLEPEFLAHAHSELAKRGVTLQLRPFAFSAQSLAALLHLGVDWYVADAPEAFRKCLDTALGEI